MDGRGNRSQHPKVCRISDTPHARCRGATGQIVPANRLVLMRKSIAGGDGMRVANPSAGAPQEWLW